MRVSCPTCNASYSVDEKKLAASGASLKCPKCKVGLKVLAPTSADTAAREVSSVSLPRANAGRQLAPVEEAKQSTSGVAHPRTTSGVSLPAQRQGSRPDRSVSWPRANAGREAATDDGPAATSGVALPRTISGVSLPAAASGPDRGSPALSEARVVWKVLEKEWFQVAQRKVDLTKWLKIMDGWVPAEKMFDLYTEILGMVGDAPDPASIEAGQVVQRLQEMERIAEQNAGGSIQAASLFRGYWLKLRKLAESDGAKAAYDARLAVWRREKLVEKMVLEADGACSDGKFEWIEQVGLRGNTTGLRLAEAEWEMVCAALKKRYPTLVIQTRQDFELSRFNETIKSFGKLVPGDFIENYSKGVAAVFGGDAAARQVLEDAVRAAGMKVGARHVEGALARGGAPLYVFKNGDQAADFEQLHGLLLDPRHRQEARDQVSKGQFAREIRHFAVRQVDVEKEFLLDLASEVESIGEDFSRDPDLAVWCFLWTTGYRSLQVGQRSYDTVEALVTDSDARPDLLREVLSSGRLAQWLRRAKSDSRLSDVAKTNSSRGELGVLSWLWAAGERRLSLGEVTIATLAEFVDTVSTDTMARYQAEQALRNDKLQFWLENALGDPKLATDASEAKATPGAAAVWRLLYCAGHRGLPGMKDVRSLEELTRAADEHWLQLLQTVHPKVFEQWLRKALGMPALADAYKDTWDQRANALHLALWAGGAKKLWLPNLVVETPEQLGPAFESARSDVEEAQRTGLLCAFLVQCDRKSEAGPLVEQMKAPGDGAPAIALWRTLWNLGWDKLPIGGGFAGTTAEVAKLCDEQPALVQERIMDLGLSMWLASKAIGRKDIAPDALGLAGDPHALELCAQLLGASAPSVRLSEGVVALGQVQEGTKSTRDFRLLAEGKRGYAVVSLESLSPEITIETAPPEVLRAGHGVDVTLTVEPPIGTAAGEHHEQLRLIVGRGEHAATTRLQVTYSISFPWSSLLGPMVGFGVLGAALFATVRLLLGFAVDQALMWDGIPRNLDQVLADSRALAGAGTGPAVIVLLAVFIFIVRLGAKSSG